MIKGYKKPAAKQLPYGCVLRFLPSKVTGMAHQTGRETPPVCSAPVFSYQSLKPFWIIGVRSFPARSRGPSVYQYIT